MMTHLYKGFGLISAILIPLFCLAGITLALTHHHHCIDHICDCTGNDASIVDDVHHTSGHVPGHNRGIYRYAGDCPAHFGGCPQTFGGYPETSGDFPQTFGVCPETSGVFPETFGDCPNTSGVCPKTFGGCPKTSGGCPETSGGCPGTFGDCPKTFGVNHVNFKEVSFLLLFEPLKICETRIHKAIGEGQI